MGFVKFNKKELFSVNTKRIIQQKYLKTNLPIYIFIVDTVSRFADLPFHQSIICELGEKYFTDEVKLEVIDLANKLWDNGLRFQKYTVHNKNYIDTCGQKYQISYFAYRGIIYVSLCEIDFSMDEFLLSLEITTELLFLDSYLNN